MRIISCRPEPPGSGNVIARADVEISDDIRCFNLKISKRPDGKFAVFGPNAMGGRVVTFSHLLAHKIGEAAVVALKETNPHDRIKA
jgi:hypothetical protein